MVQAQANYPLDTRERLTAAIASDRDWLLERQAADGHWCAELEGDTILESEYLIYLHFIEKLDPETVRKAANYIRSKLLPEGGVAPYPGGPTDLSGSVKAYLALKMAGDPIDARHMVTMRQAI